LHGGKSIEGSEQRPRIGWCNSKVESPTDSSPTVSIAPSQPGGV
jgi:hypothetical protein